MPRPGIVVTDSEEKEAEDNIFPLKCQKNV